MKTYIARLILVTLVLFVANSCDLERLESAQEVAEGGGTLDRFTAYTIDSTDPMGSNVYGRIVFWKTDLDQTLVQISLYNTVADFLHPAILVEGAAGIGTSEMMTLDEVDGSTGELSDSKFFLIPDTAYYDTITTLDAHVSISLSPTDGIIVATGNLGINADPVDSN